MPKSENSVTITWNGLVIQITIPEEQQFEIIQQVMSIIHNASSAKELSASTLFLAEEEQHLRQLLLQYHQNRRIVENQKAKYGSAEVPLVLENQLRDINEDICDVSIKIDAIVKQRRESSDLRP